MHSYYAEDELSDIGFQSIGSNVLISRKASFYGAERIEIGDHVRIDDFCLLSGRIKLGNYIHITAGCYLYGAVEGITMEDFSTLAARVVIHADSDDYSGNSLTNTMTGKDFKNILSAPVRVGRHAIIGTGSVVLPGVYIGEGCAIGAMSLVRSSTKPWTINVGIPCREIKERSRRLLEMEQRFLIKRSHTQ